MPRSAVLCLNQASALTIKSLDMITDHCKITLLWASIPRSSTIFANLQVTGDKQFIKLQISSLGSENDFLELNL